MIQLVGTHVRLRAFRPDELDTVWPIHAAGRRARGLSLRGGKERLARLFRQSGTLDRDLLYLAIEANGVLAGEIDARRKSTGLPPGVFELGVALYEPVDRGKGVGTAAIELLVDRLFAHEQAERIEVRTAVDNRAMCRVLEKLGFVREGTLRRFMPGEAGRSDYAIYALLSAEWDGRGVSHAPAAPK
jgi:RimJ/RimL family protein N-acetyltransferase